MSDVIGIAWFKDADTYDRALAVFIDPNDLPDTYEDWQAIVKRQCEMIKGNGDIALRADIDPETFAHWCATRGLVPNSQGRIAFTRYVELEYQKTGEGIVV